jgi:hypothetical protein
MTALKKRAAPAGAGHAHLYTLKHAQEFARQGHELVFVSPGPFWYFGLSTGRCKLR